MIYILLAIVGSGIIKLYFKGVEERRLAAVYARANAVELQKHLK